MTVAELIEKLMKYDPEENVLILCECSYEIRSVCEIDNGVVVVP